MNRDFLSLSPSPICSHVPAGGLLEEKFISRMIKLACMPIFTPPLLSLFLLHPPFFLLHSHSFHPTLPPFLLSAPALSLLHPPNLTTPPPSSCCAMSLSFCHINFILKRGGKCENFPWRPLISVGEELRVEFGGVFSPLFTEHSFIINWQPSH